MIKHNFKKFETIVATVFETIVAIVFEMVVAMVFEFVAAIVIVTAIVVEMMATIAMHYETIVEIVFKTMDEMVENNFPTVENTVETKRGIEAINLRRIIVVEDTMTEDAMIIEQFKMESSTSSSTRRFARGSTTRFYVENRTR